MAYTRRIPLVPKTDSVIERATFRAKISGSGALDGLWLPDDTTPTSGSMGTGYSNLYSTTNLSYNNPTVSGSYYTKPSIGLRLNDTYYVRSLHLFDIDTSGSVGRGTYISGSHSGVEVYQSDNGTAWTLIERINPVQRYIHSGSYYYRTDLLLGDGSSTYGGSYISGSYFKCNFFSGSIMSEAGNFLQYTHMFCGVDPAGYTSITYSGSRTPVTIGNINPAYSTDAGGYVSQTNKLEF